VSGSESRPLRTYDVDERSSMASGSGVHQRTDRSGVAATGRVSCRREPDPEGTAAESAAACEK